MINATFLRKLDWAVSTHVGFSMFASLGSMLNIDFGDLVDYPAHPPQLWFCPAFKFTEIYFVVGGQALQNDKKWYQKSAEDAFDALESRTAGLSTDESRAMLGKYGYNELKFKKRSVIK